VPSLPKANLRADKKLVLRPNPAKKAASPEHGQVLIAKLLLKLPEPAPNHPLGQVEVNPAKIVTPLIPLLVAGSQQLN